MGVGNQSQVLDDVNALHFNANWLITGNKVAHYVEQIRFLYYLAIARCSRPACQTIAQFLNCL